MAVAGDLHWERKEAGVYETSFWANNYLYRIVNTNRNTGYSSQGAWTTLYKWRHDPKKQWKRIPGTFSSHDTLKHAKRVCVSHNLNPRAKWKAFGRVTAEEAGKSRVLKDKIGFIKFHQVGKDRKPMMFKTMYVDPKTFSTDLDEKKNQDIDYILGSLLRIDSRKAQ